MDKWELVKAGGRALLEERMKSRKHEALEKVDQGGAEEGLGETIAPEAQKGEWCKLRQG